MSSMRTPTPPGSEKKTTGSIRRIGSAMFRIPPRPVTPVPLPPPPLRMKLRRQIVVAMVVAALVPVAIVAMIATGVILSSLDTGLHDDADRQLTVGLNLILRSVERLGDETVQLSESAELVVAFESGRRRSRRGSPAKRRTCRARGCSCSTRVVRSCSTA